jgi:hypothetical protein
MQIMNWVHPGRLLTCFNALRHMLLPMEDLELQKAEMCVDVQDAVAVSMYCRAEGLWVGAAVRAAVGEVYGAAFGVARSWWLGCGARRRRRWWWTVTPIFFQVSGCGRHDCVL